MPDLVQRIINRALLLQVGSHVLMIIKERTLRGEYLPGSTGTGQYSTTPMPLPLGVLQKKYRSNKSLKELEAGGARIFTNLRSKITWIILTGGYKQLREITGRDASHVTLSWSGKMMRNLKVLKADPATASVTIGFDEESSSRIASYHQIEGAGKSKKTHKFLGLTEQEISDVGEFVKGMISFQ
jgi:hypothetical protein